MNMIGSGCYIVISIVFRQGRREVFEAKGQYCKMRPLESVIEVSRRGRQQGNLGELHLKEPLEPCRLLLLEDSLYTSKEAIKLLILVD